MKNQSNGSRLNNNAGTVAQLEKLLEFLKSEEGISAAHQVVRSTLPKQAPRGGAGVRKSGR